MQLYHIVHPQGMETEVSSIQIFIKYYNVCINFGNEVTLVHSGVECYQTCQYFLTITLFNLYYVCSYFLTI